MEGFGFGGAFNSALLTVTEHKHGGEGSFARHQRCGSGEVEGKRKGRDQKYMTGG